MPLQASVELLLHIVHKPIVYNDPSCAVRLFSFIRSHSLQRHSFLGNHLVVVLVHGARILEAQRLFDTLPYKDEISWNALITGYSNRGKLYHAFSLYAEMLKEIALHPAVQTLVALLKACARLDSVEIGIEIHADIRKHGWHRQNVYVGSALIDMYAKCGFLAEAHELFDLLAPHSVIALTSLIGGYIEHGEGEKALQCFNTMQEVGMTPDAPVFVLSLKSCGSIKAKDKGQEIHAEIERRGLLDGNLFLASALVDMYSRCNLLAQALEVAKVRKPQCLASWNALISGLAEGGHGDKALDCFQELQRVGIIPDVITLTSCVKACTMTGNLVMGLVIHAELERLSMLEADPVACNALVDMHMKCGNLAVASEFFNSLPSSSIVSWNTIIAGFVDRRHGDRALNFYKSMRAACVAPNHLTLASCLKACSQLMDLGTGQELHAEIEIKGFLYEDIVVGNTLVSFYAKFGLLSAAQKVFDKVTAKDPASWSVLIGGYIENGYDHEALKRFDKMEIEGVSPNPTVLVWTLQACSRLGWEEKGLMLHAEIERRASFVTEVAMAVTDMYITFALFVNAKEMFERFFFGDESLWNALPEAFTKHGHHAELPMPFEYMQFEGLSCHAATIVWSLKTCGTLCALEKGQYIHAELERLGLVNNSSVISGVLINMYINLGLLGRAKDVFSKVPTQDVVSWTMLISGYAENDQGEEALECLQLMQGEGIFPNDVTLLCSLKACGIIGAADMGRELHCEVERRGLLQEESLIGNALIDMYASCGLLTSAKQVFEKLQFRTVVSWTALMAGYAQSGLSDYVFQIYEQMLLECIKPDLIMFVVILNTCSRMSLTEQSDTYYNVMCKEHGIVPADEHLYCVLDLICRAGDLVRAEKVMKHLPSSDLVPWHTILSACKHFGNVKLGRHVFQSMMLQGNKFAASFALISSILRT